MSVRFGLLCTGEVGVGWGVRVRWDVGEIDGMYAEIKRWVRGVDWMGVAIGFLLKVALFRPCMF
jgi:hypothetical protein